MKIDWAEITRHWLGRLTFSFLVVAFVLGWVGYKRYAAAGGAVGDWQTLLDFVAAALAAALGIAGLRRRHSRSAQVDRPAEADPRADRKSTHSAD
jgi:hypothetical protein